MEKSLPEGRCHEGVSTGLHYQQEISTKVDRCFTFFFGIQWVIAAMIPALMTSEGEFKGLEPAVVGALLALPTMYLTWAHRGQRITRYAVTLTQAGFAGLFLYLVPGRPETHYYIFVSLAALSCYMDVGILWLGALLISFIHLVSGWFVPPVIFGEILWLSLFSLVLSFGLRRVNSYVRDLGLARHQLRLAKEAALRQSALKSNFLSNMSHEIRTPLSSIIGFSEILSETNLDQEQREYVSTVHRCSETLLHLLNNILDVSKIENGHLELDQHSFDLRELHQDISRMFSLSCSEKGLHLQLTIDPAIPCHVLGDSHRLRQVLVNLVSNAIKFTDKGFIRIDVRADVACSLYHWQVRDTGRGIHAENIGNLFRSFYQEDASVSRKYGGTGLGLTIVKNLVEIMGGKISVDSRPGEGTVFSFSLPMSAG